MPNIRWDDSKPDTKNSRLLFLELTHRPLLQEDPQESCQDDSVLSDSRVRGYNLFP